MSQGPSSNSGSGNGLPTRPTIVSVTDDVGPLTGPLTSGGVTNDTDLTVRVGIEGTGAAAGDTIQLYKGGGTGTQLGLSYTLTDGDIANGYADVQTGTLADGSRDTITARRTDQTGTQSDASANNFSITIDTTPPAAPLITGITPHVITDPATTTVADVTVIGTAEAGSTLTLFDGIELVGTVLVDLTGQWSLPITFDTGLNALSAVATDTAGNVSTPGSFSAMLDPAACFARGTRIAVPGGETPVEALRIGDLVLTGNGTAEPIRWIGRRSYTPPQLLANRHLRKVIIVRDAIAPGMPHRDLAVSPMHALLVDDQLIPSASLVNGVSIRRDEACAPLTYLHIELDRHDIIFAEGLPAESFLDDGSRLLFDNADDEPPIHAVSRIPLDWRIEEGRGLEACRRHLARRAACPPPNRPPGALQGHIERNKGGHVEGWAINADNPMVPVELALSAPGHPDTVFFANRYRADLDYHGLGIGVGGFRIPLPRGANPSTIEIRRLTDDARLPSQIPTPAPACILEPV